MTETANFSILHSNNNTDKSDSAISGTLKIYDMMPTNHKKILQLITNMSIHV